MRNPEGKTLYFVSGTMGVGKTTVCQILKRKLDRSVFLDGDWCWDAHPFQVTEETKAMVQDHICHLLNGFLHCTAYQNVIFCWVMQEQSIADSILSNLDLSHCRLRAVSLVCDAGTLRGRLEKDVALGVREGDIVERSLARLPLYQSLSTVKVDTTGKSPQEVAEEIAAL